MKWTGRKMKWNEDDEMNEMADEMGEMANEMEREREGFFFGKYKVSGDPDFHLILSA